jgi:hypothetical protein
MKTITSDELVTATGGMNLDGFRQSTNIEDRRSPKAVAEDNKWWSSTHPSPTIDKPATNLV